MSERIPENGTEQERSRESQLKGVLIHLTGARKRERKEPVSLSARRSRCLG